MSKKKKRDKQNQEAPAPSGNPLRRPPRLTWGMSEPGNLPSLGLPNLGMYSSLLNIGYGQQETAAEYLDRTLADMNKDMTGFAYIRSVFDNDACAILVAVTDKSKRVGLYAVNGVTHDETTVVFEVEDAKKLVNAISHAIGLAESRVEVES